MTKKIKIVERKKYVVHDPKNLPTRRDGNLDRTWCNEHNEYFDHCTCPKPNSTPDKDGWLVFEEGLIKYAYPTADLEEALSMWIDVDSNNGTIHCSRCGETLNINQLTIDTNMLSITEMVESFYEIHQNCE